MNWNKIKEILFMDVIGCTHARGTLIKEGELWASDDLACYFWKEAASVNTCPKCKKNITWSFRECDGKWKPISSL
jgi:hypothetical protein